jgi:hypothetical protein
MPNAGDIMTPSTVSRRVGTTSGVSDGTTTSAGTESVYETVTVNVVSGQTYHIRCYFPYVGSIACDRFLIRLREGTTIAGAQITYSTAVPNATVPTTAVLVETPESDWIAPSTGSQSFCVTAQRNGGSGTLTPKGATTSPRLLTVDFIAI